MYLEDEIKSYENSPERQSQKTRNLNQNGTQVNNQAMDINFDQQ